MAGAADQVKRVTLELGGKSANIIFADADLETAAASAPGSVFDNAGQDCCARSRILVQRSVYDAFLGLLEPAVQGFRVRAPADPQAEMGPLITAGQLASVSAYVDGTDVAFTGTRSAAPAISTAASGTRRPWCCRPRRPTGSGARRCSGRWSPCCRSRTRPTRSRLANDSDFGLSGSIFTADVGRALRVARGVEAGNLSVNSHSSVRYWTPFGGFKQSGLGRELGPDAPAAFSEVKNVFIATG